MVYVVNTVVLAGIVCKGEKILKKFPDDTEYVRFLIYCPAGEKRGELIPVCALGTSALLVMSLQKVHQRVRLTGRLKSWKSPTGTIKVEVQTENLKIIEKRKEKTSISQIEIK